MIGDMPRRHRRSADRQPPCRDESRRSRLLAETDRYLAELAAEVGEPTSEEKARAAAFVRRIAPWSAAVSSARKG